MSEGFYQMHRGWMDHPNLATNAPYTRREVWIWLIENASWENRRIKTNHGEVIELKRGQLSHSLRFLAEKWGWHKSKVERFLKELEKEAMIETQSETGQNIVTLCNYDNFQLKPKFHETVSDPLMKPSARRKRDSGETKKNTFNPFNTFNNKALATEKIEKINQPTIEIRKPQKLDFKIPSAYVEKLKGGFTEEQIFRWFNEVEFIDGGKTIVFKNKSDRDHVSRSLESRLRVAFGFHPNLEVST